MPPRYTYWTIILDGQPTAFRAADRETLLPTLKQLQSKNPDATLKWFARGKVWDSPEQARVSRVSRPPAAPGREGARPGGERRDKEWRPGGEHRDPRQKFKKETFQARRRREKKAAAMAAGQSRGPSLPRGKQPGGIHSPGEHRRGHDGDRRGDAPGKAAWAGRPKKQEWENRPDKREWEKRPKRREWDSRSRTDNRAGKGETRARPGDRPFKKPRPDRIVGREEPLPEKQPDRHLPIVTEPTRPPEPERRPLPQEEPPPSRPAPPERIRIEPEPPEQGTPPGDRPASIAPPHETKMPRLRRSR